jgi:hypothetical protein
MLQLDSELKKNIINKLEEIISIEQNNWNNLDVKIKIKLIHHYCNFININNIKNDNNINYDVNKIPLKSLRPKKLIQYACFNKQYNKKLYNDYLNDIKEYTTNFRNLFLKNKIYHTFNNLPKELYNNILNSYNKHVCDFLKKNKSLILIDNFYNNLVGNNSNKIITEMNEEKSIEIIEKNNKIELIFNNNIHIILELFLTSNKITNNIPVKFNVKIINKF